jgi:hypothetical protein
MKTSEKIDQLLPDLFKVKASILPLKKQADNPYFNSKYVDLNAVLEGVDSILEANGFILLQPVVGRTVETTILHKSGQFITSEMELVLDKNTMQALGSAISYARRYSLVSLLGLKSEDDDGNGASYDKAPPPKAKPAAKAATSFTKPATATNASPNITTSEIATAIAAPATKPVAEPARAKPAPFFNPKAAKPVSNGNASQFD